MEGFRARMTVPGVLDTPVAVEIDLVNDQIAIHSEGELLGSWGIEEVRIIAHRKGFEVQVGGERVLFSTDDDFGFARAVGVQGARPRLRHLVPIPEVEEESEPVILSPSQPNIPGSSDLRSQFTRSLRS